VICVDNPLRKKEFTIDDLDFLIAVAHYAASAVSNRVLQQDLRHYIEVQKRLLTNFSEKVRNKIVDQARTGRLKPGGEKSDVTLLMSDLRAFTRTSAEMSTEEVVEMLNEYFSAQIEAIFRNGGTWTSSSGTPFSPFSEAPSVTMSSISTQCRLPLRYRTPCIR